MTIDRFTKEEFEAALPNHNSTGNPLWKHAGLDKGEHIYTIEVIGTNKRIVIRSSIRVDGRAAPTGGDSIRHWVEYRWRGSWHPLSKGTKKYTTRVPGWQERLLEALRELWALALEDSRR